MVSKKGHMRDHVKKKLNDSLNREKSKDSIGDINR